MNNFEQCPLSRGTDISATATEKTKRDAWNKGLAMGQKIGLNKRQVKKIYRHLKKKQHEKNGLRNIVMFTVAGDTMLRASDLMSLKVSQIFLSNGKVRKHFLVKQGKSKRNVTCVLTWKTRRILKHYQKQYNLSKNDYLFQGVGTTTHFSTRQFRRLIKQWVEAIDLPSEDYSTHSMRRTKANILFRKSHKDWNIVRCMLGHSSIRSTQTYIHAEDDKALTLAGRITLF